MTDYSNQNITGQDLSGVNLTGANFTNTNATNVNFTNATITNAIFKNTLITGASISTLVFSDIQKGHLLLRAANQTIAAVNNLTSLTPAQFRIIQPAISADTITMIQTVTVKIPNSQGEGYTMSVTPVINQLICIFVATNQNIILTASGTNVRTIRSNGTVVQDVDSGNTTLNYLKIGNIPYRLTVGNGDGVIAMIPVDLNVYQVNGSGLGDIVSLNLGSGATGPTGPTGTAGSAGAAGTTGPTGSSFIYDGIPVNQPVNNLYMDTSYNLYGNSDAGFPQPKAFPVYSGTTYTINNESDWTTNYALANNGDILLFNAAVTFTSTKTIDKSVMIKGNVGSSVTYSTVSNIFTVTASNVCFTTMTFNNSNTDGNANIIAFNNSSGFNNFVNGCSLQTNEFAISTNNANIQISNNTFSFVGTADSHRYIILTGGTDVIMINNNIFQGNGGSSTQCININNQTSPFTNCKLVVTNNQSTVATVQRLIMVDIALTGSNISFYVSRNTITCSSGFIIFFVSPMLTGVKQIYVIDNVEILGGTATGSKGVIGLDVVTTGTIDFTTLIYSARNTIPLLRSDYTDLTSTLANQARVIAYATAKFTPLQSYSLIVPFIANITGPTGPTGPTGAVGAQGVTGTAGSTGPTGAVGAQGVAGTAGVTGTAGSTGPTGPAGAQGTAGAAGTAGVTGTAGSTGPTGPAGAQGTAGAAGTAGVTGTAGSTGPTGPLGLVGPTGPAGSGGGGGGTTGPTGPAPNFSTTLEDRNLPNGSFNGFLTNAYFTNTQSWDFTNYDYVVLFEYRQTASLGESHIRYSWFDDVTVQRYNYLSMDNTDGIQTTQDTNEPILLYLNGITSATGPMDIQHYVKITFSRPKFSTNTITGQVEQFSSARDSNGFPNRAFKSVASIAYSSASVTTGILSSRLVFYNDASGGAVANQGYCKIMRKPRAESGGEFQSLGSTGPTGPAGAQGAAGTAGPTGPQGSSVIFDGSYSSIGSFAGYTNNQFTFPNLTWDFTNYNYDIEFTLTQNNAFNGNILWNWDNLATSRYIQSYLDKDMTTNTLYTGSQMSPYLFYLQGQSDINFHFKGTLRANRPVVNIPHMMILEGQTTYVRVSNNSTNYSASESSIGYSRTTNTLLFTSISTFPTNPFDGVHNLSFWSTNSNYPSFNPNIRMRVVRVPKV